VIVRIMGEGQLSVDDAVADQLNTLDEHLDAAVQRDDEQAFHTALSSLQDRVRAAGAPLPADTLQSSDLIVPRAGATMDEVRELLAGGGLIPG
jgi:chromosome condensin MukBEF complex kleisin-like MukF subunit